MVHDRTVITKNAHETQALGQDLGNRLRTQKVEFRTQKKREGRLFQAFCLYGELGSGKTTFVKGCARGLGITCRLLSPTFIIVRRYQIPQASNVLYHIDLYRLLTPEELEELGISEILENPHSYVFIEWAEKLGVWLPKERTDIHFSILPSGDYSIRFA